jgi:hypothetical protein
MARQKCGFGGTQPVDAATAVMRAKCRYQRLLARDMRGREYPLVELAQRRLEWERAIVAEMDERLARP